MKKLILWILTLIPILATALSIPFMDDRVPMHYDIAGKVDRYGSKYENFIFPVTILFFTLFWLLMIRYFERKAERAEQEKEREEAKSNAGVIYIAAYGTTVMFDVMQCFLLFKNILVSASAPSYVLPSYMQPFFDFHVVTTVLLGIFMIVIGNYLPKAKLNSIVGIRTVWSMKNDVVWSKSNRFGGILFVICGALIVIEAVVFKGLAVSLTAVGMILCSALAATIYSYRIYKKTEQEERA